jgi:hypothetical protein
MDQFLGFFGLGTDLNAAIAIAPPSGTPVDPTVNPTYRVYEGNVLLTGGVGSLAKMDTGVITGATNASPISITSAAHGLQTGNVVTITGVGGNTAANGTFVITKTGDNTFTLNGSTGNSAYTSGGAWHVTGLYSLALTISAGNGYDVGKTYSVRIDWQVSSTLFTKVAYFTVV